MKVRISPLDALFSRYIRMRADERCERCHAYKGYAGLQCAHFHSRRKKSVRYDPDNCLALCFGCHQYFHENPDEFRAFMKLRLGEYQLNMLDVRARQPIHSLDQQAVKLWLDNQIKKMEE